MEIHFANPLPSDKMIPVMKPVIYTTPSCVYCKFAKALFIENNVEYEEKNVALDMEAQREMIQKSGQLGVPVTDFGDEIVIGFDKRKFLEKIGVTSK